MDTSATLTVFILVFLVVVSLSAGNDLQSIIITTKVDRMRAQSNLIVDTFKQQPSAWDAHKLFQESVLRAGFVVKDVVKQANFVTNLQKIRDTNTRAASHVAGCNGLSDVNSTVFLRNYTGLSGVGRYRFRNMTRGLMEELEAEVGLEVVDWEDYIMSPAYDVGASSGLHRRRGRSLQQDIAAVAEDPVVYAQFLPPVKDQGDCGSCYAHAATSVAEVAHYLKTAEPISLFENQIVWCSEPHVQNSCSGGSVLIALFYTRKWGLVASQSRSLTCDQMRAKPASKLATVIRLQPNNETAMLEALLLNGPIAVSVSIDDSWQHYVGGVFTSSTCNTLDMLNHAVVIVGAGVDDSNGVKTPYWLIRNSWGPNWGEAGYMRIRRGEGWGSPGECNIAAYPYQGVSAGGGNAGAGDSSPPQSTCKPTEYIFRSNDTLEAVAMKFNTSMAKLLLDNNYFGQNTTIPDGARLNISCPDPTNNGVWLAPAGVVLRFGNPYVGVCPRGTFATSFYVKPSLWGGSADDPSSNWVGKISMTCSGTNVIKTTQQEFVIDALPVGGDSGFQDGLVRNTGGFMNVAVRFNNSATPALISLMGIGPTTPPERLLACPNNTLVAGFSAGIPPSPDVNQYGSWIANFQVLCRYFDSNKVATLRLFSDPQQTGLACKTYSVKATDTWLRVVRSTPGITLSELQRVNPSITRELKMGDVIVLPPCARPLGVEDASPPPDMPPSPPPTPPMPPSPRCTNVMYTFNVATDTLASVAAQFNTTVSYLVLDNNLAGTPEDGTRLNITCRDGAIGVWSDVFAGIPGITMQTTAAVCPLGSFARSFYIEPSGWSDVTPWTGSNWVGQISMTCSDANSTTFILDAQPGRNPGWNDDTVTSNSGFSAVPMRIGPAVNSIFGVGAQYGIQRNFTCPPGSVISGFAGGADPYFHHMGSWVVNLQFLCR